MDKIIMINLISLYKYIKNIIHFLKKKKNKKSINWNAE